MVGEFVTHDSGPPHFVSLNHGSIAKFNRSLRTTLAPIAIGLLWLTLLDIVESASGSSPLC